MVLLSAVALVGLVLLTAAADQLVIGCGRLAARLGVAPVVVGVVVIGLGTSAPEFVVSGLAAAHRDTGLALGNLVGSNIVNLTLILGVAGLIRPVAVRSSVPRREAPLAAAGVILFAIGALVGLGRVAGAILAVALVGTVVLLVRLARVGPRDPLPDEVGDLLAEQGRRPRPGREALRAVLGLAGTLAGAQLMVTGAAGAARHLGISQAVIGFTLVALGTSLPELVTAIQAQRRRDTDLLVGNLLGSNLFNSLAGGALVGLANHGPPARLGTPVLAAMVAVTLLTWLALRRRYQVTRLEAAALLVAYLATLALIS
jgi:cation:H+ antiporter